MTKFVQRPLLVLIFVALLSLQAMGQTPDVHQQVTPSASPANRPSQSFDLGQLDGTNYVNSFFGLSLSIPTDWVVTNAQRRAALDEQTKKMVNSSDPKKLARVEESIERSKTLLRITKLPDGQPNNAQLMLIAERLASPSLKTGLDVIEAMKQTMKGTNFTVELLGEIHTETLSTAEFGVVNVKVTSPYGVYKQKIYVMVSNDYALELFFTYLDDADLPAFAGILKSIKLK